MIAARLGAAAAALTLAVAAKAQLLVPETPREALERSRFFAGLDASVFGVESFVDRNGFSQSIAGLRIFDGELRVSWSPVSHFAIGVSGAYRYSRLSAEAAEFAVSVSGLSGAGAFVLWSPSGPSAGLPIVFEIGAFGAPDERDRVLTVRDGKERLVLGVDLATRRDALPHDWRAALDVRFQLGQGTRSRGKFYDSEIQLAAGPRLIGSAGVDLHALALVGGRVSSGAPQEGLFFNDFGASSLFVGPSLQLDAPSGWSGAVGATWNSIRVRNGVKGWQAFARLRRLI